MEMPGSPILGVSVADLNPGQSLLVLIVRLRLSLADSGECWLIIINASNLD
jgi:hypothetical protein